MLESGRDQTDMSKLRILHSADLHLDSPFEGLSAGKAAIRRGEQRELLSALAALARREQADIVLAFENLEALRALPYVKKGGTVVVNTQQILPMPVITGAVKYPEDCLERVNAACNTIEINAVDIAHECGTYRAANVVLMGVVAKMLPFSVDEWHKAIEQCVKPKFLDINIKAFDRGYNY